MSGAFRQQTSVFINQNLSPEARSAFLAKTAREGVADLVASSRAPPNYTRVVDGAVGAPESSVKPDGVIGYRFQYLGEIAAFALAFLQGRSPSGHGAGGSRMYRSAYRDSFYLGLARGTGEPGRFVQARQFNPLTMGADVAEITIGNLQPYSRLLDVQFAGQRRVRYSVPPGIFEDAVRAVNQRFGNQVTARRAYRQKFPGIYLLKTGRRAGSMVESPALIIAGR